MLEPAKVCFGAHCVSWAEAWRAAHTSEWLSAPKSPASAAETSCEERQHAWREIPLAQAGPSKKREDLCIVVKGYRLPRHAFRRIERLLRAKDIRAEMLLKRLVGIVNA